MKVCCSQDDRRDAVRKTIGRNGLDYIEVDPDQLTLLVYFLGKLPQELREDKPEIDRYLRIEGGQRVTGIRITDVDPVVNPDPELDDYLVLKLDKYGDFSTYAVRLIGVENIDPYYDRAEFSFKIDCPSDLDCLPACACEPEVFDEPQINYLGKDYQSFRQVILDRLAVVVPNWTERHAADLEVALVEALAYTGDYLSYYQDAVATEAYLDTARRRISVQRHARLVDYRLHEGCNARAWVSLTVSEPLKLDPKKTAFITGMNQALLVSQDVLIWDDLRETPKQSYEVFEPLVWSTPIQLYDAHNEIRFHTWGNTQCCLERGSTTATLIDTWIPGKQQPPPNGKPQSQDYEYKNKAEQEKKPKPERLLKLTPGDVLIFEELLGPITGLPADADPNHRHAVRLTRVTSAEDPLIRTQDGQPTPIVHIEWSAEDKLPFPLCLSAIGMAPECHYVENISVAHGNIVLVDHGKTQNPESLGTVGTFATETKCECVGGAADVLIVPDKFTARLEKTPLTFSAPLSRVKWKSAASLITQNPREGLPQVSLNSKPALPWKPLYDLLGSGADDADFVVEIDNEGIAHLRFGDGELGYRPAPDMTFTATYRTGNGSRGNVGPESISRLVLNDRLSGVSVSVRNPLPARGGTDAEPLEEGRLFAPFWFRKQSERAIIARDYEEIAERSPKLQQASGALVWTGSWYEADVAVDPLGREDADESLLKGIAHYLERYRRMGHDLAVLRGRYVPLKLTLEVCALPHFQRAHVKAALLEVFSNRIFRGSRRGFFHPDNLTFGEGIYSSQIVAAGQAVPGVECVRVVEFHRLFESPNQEIENGVLPLSVYEIAQLDNDPNYPEHGQIEIQMAGGR